MDFGAFVEILGHRRVSPHFAVGASSSQGCLRRSGRRQSGDGQGAGSGQARQDSLPPAKRPCLRRLLPLPADMHRKIVLDNGVRLVTEHMPSAKSVTVGIWVNVGSRDEAKGEEGFSHFIEHMFFKGTRTRSAIEISREIDALGGEMNAFTGRETTTFYVFKVLDQHLPQALVLLSDLFHHAKFASKEVEKEKQVDSEEEM